MRQDIDFESGLLRVGVRGVFSLEEAKQAFLEVLGAVAQYGARKVLIDGRKVKGNPRDFERFYYGELAAQETQRLYNETKISPRFAYLIHGPLRDPGRFGEIVALNRGMNVKVFETLEEACEWLHLAPATKPEQATHERRA
jgi:hypothetical protein